MTTSKFRFKRIGLTLWQVQKRRNLFWWDDLKIRSVSIQVKEFAIAYPTLETVFDIKVEGVRLTSNPNIVSIIY